MLLFILPGLLLTWALVSIFDGSGSGSDAAGTDKTTDLGPEDDTFDGTAANDTVNSFDGDDVITGNRGADTLNLGAGDDEGYGGAGTDRIFGGDGSDFMDGGTNNDGLFGGNGNDFTYLPETDTSAEVLGDYNGDDLIRGGAGNDLLFDSLGRNTIYGDTGNDVVAGWDDEVTATPDLLYGGFGADVILADNGDTASGGAGADQFAILRYDGDQPVEITDYDVAAGEKIFVEYLGAGAGVLSLAEDTGNTLVQVDGVTVARLVGVTGVDPANLGALLA